MAPLLCPHVAAVHLNYLSSRSQNYVGNQSVTSNYVLGQFRGKGRAFQLKWRAKSDEFALFRVGRSVGVVGLQVSR